MSEPAPRLGLPAIRMSTATALRLLVSFVLALLLWGWVTTRQDPITAATYPAVPLSEPEPPEPLQLVDELGDVTVRLLIEGPRSQTADLSEADLDPRLDLSEIDGPGEYTLPIEVTLPAGVRVEQMEPRQLTIRVDEPANRTFHLVPEPIVPDDNARRIGEIVPEPSDVTVTGPKTYVDQVARVVLPIEIGERTSDFSAEFEPVAENVAGEAITQVRVRPGRVAATVPVEARGRSVPVLIQIAGSPQQGYEVVDRVANPDMVVLDGPDEVIDEIVAVSTAPVVVEGETGPISRTVGLEGLPPEVRVVDPADGNVMVLVQVQARGASQTLAGQAVAVTDLAPGLAATVEPTTVDVVIFAAEDALAALRAGEIVPQVSAAGLGAGTYELPLEVSVPAGVQWLGTEPAMVAVTIGPAPGGGTPVASPGTGPG